MIAFLGDIHGSFDALYLFEELLRSVLGDELEEIVVLGDVGIWPETIIHIPDFKSRISFIRGNHESYPLLEEWDKLDLPLHYWKDGETRNLYNYRFTALGGAYSIDRHHRKLNGTDCAAWYREEIPNREMAEKVGTEDATDVLLTHALPPELAKRVFSRIKINSDENGELSPILYGTIPFIFCGHYHIYRDTRVQISEDYSLNIIALPSWAPMTGRQFILLDEDGFYVVDPDKS
jgi:hypothetical protein